MIPLYPNSCLCIRTYPAFRLAAVGGSGLERSLSLLRPSVQTGARVAGEVPLQGTSPGRTCTLRNPAWCFAIRHHISRLRTYDENSCAVSLSRAQGRANRKTGPAPTPPSRELGRSPSYRSDCKFGWEKSLEAGLLPKRGPQSECGVKHYIFQLEVI